MICSACSGPIEDAFLFKIGEDYWHEKCMKCSLCDAKLAERCYEKFGSLFCVKDYFGQFSPNRCFLCDVGIAPTEHVFKLKPNVICHIECQRCSVCSMKLGQGSKIGVDEIGRRLLCSQHISTVISTDFGRNVPKSAELSSKTSTSLGVGRMKGERYMDSGGYDSIPEEQIIVDGHASSHYVRRRGPRTTIRPSQLDMLNRTFNDTPKPSKHTRAKLALETGLSMRVIQVWFQNRRSKERRLKHLCNRLREFEGTSNTDLALNSCTDSLVALAEESESEEDDDDEPSEGNSREARRGLS